MRESIEAENFARLAEAQRRDENGCMGQLAWDELPICEWDSVKVLQFHPAAVIGFLKSVDFWYYEVDEEAESPD